ncbi:MAG: hypothetical protein RBU21_21035 [FCB group bacterium]|nr:hypothetical protein [FCB group bacterium]
MARHFVSLFAALLLPVLASAQTDPAPAPVGLARYRVESSRAEAADETTLDVQVNLQPAPTSPVEFLCEIRTERVLREAQVVGVIRNGNGETVHDKSIELSVQPGVNKCQFVWDTQSLPLGIYWARFTLLRRGAFEGPWCEVVFTKMAELPLAEKIEQASTAATGMAQFVQETMKDDPVPYARMRLALAREFAARARDSFARNEWQRAEYYANYALDTTDSVRVRLALAKELPELSGSTPPVSLGGLRIRNGCFYADNRPVFLMGGRGGEDLLRDLPRLGEMKLGLAAFDLAQPGMSVESIASAFDLARDANVSLTVLLSPFKVSDAAALARPDIRVAGGGNSDIDLANAEAREFIEDYLRTSVAPLQGQTMVNGVVIAQNPAFQFDGPAVRAGFLGHIQETYPSVEEINRVWKARFRNIGELDLIWEPGRYDYKRRVGYQYDWQAYNQWLGTDYLNWMNNIVSAAAPDVPSFVQLADNVLASGEAELGIDREALGQMMDISGCAVDDSPSSGVYALNYPNASFNYTLLRSIAPDKPVYNVGHQLLSSELPYDRNLQSYVYTALLDGAMSGLNASALATWSHAPAKDGLDGTLLDRPECLEAYATANLDLNRLAEIVTAFQQAPADVAILWSMPSKIYESGDPYLASVRRAFEGCSFAGRQIRFITEEQIVRDGLAGVNILVIPDAPALGSEIINHKSAPGADRTFNVINAYNEAGGVIIRPGNPIPFTARGTSRQDLLSPTPHTILVRGTDTAEGYLDAMDAAYSMGAVAELPRAVKEYGYPLEGVKTRHIDFGGKSYLYIVNLRKETVRCTLEGPRKSGRDILRGRWVTFPMELQSLDPMLIQLEEVAPDKAMPVVDIAASDLPPKRKIDPKDISRGAVRKKDTK